MKRSEAESQLDFIGLIIFENKLKPSTQGVLEVLEKAHIRKLMCTGDNILTAISVARECTLIDKTAHCFVPHFAEGTSLFEGTFYTLQPLIIYNRAFPGSKFSFDLGEHR